MRTYVAQWPNGEITIVALPSKHTKLDLFRELDQEADPSNAKVVEIGTYPNLPNRIEIATDGASAITYMGHHGWIDDKEPREVKGLIATEVGI